MNDCVMHEGANEWMGCRKVDHAGHSARFDLSGQSLGREVRRLGYQERMRRTSWCREQLGTDRRGQVERFRGDFTMYFILQKSGTD